MIRVRKLSVFMLAAGLGLATATGVAAQEVPPHHDHEAIEVTQELLERFTDVYPEVMGIAQTAQAELATAETPEQAQAIQSRAQEQITSVLNEGEVTVQEYEAVVMRLNEDEELRAQFEEMLEERMQERAGG